MKLCFKFLLILIFYVSISHGQRVSLIGSYFVPNDQSNYKAFLSSNNLKPSNVDVTLSAGGRNEMKSFTAPVNNVELRPPSANRNGYELQIKAKTCRSQPIKLQTASDRSIILVNFATPVYKTGDEFKFQIFILDHNLNPRRSFRDFTVIIYDSEGHMIKYYSNMPDSNFGVFEAYFQIADSPNLGKWLIEVNGAGRKVTKSFFVMKPKRNGMELFVDFPSMIAFDDRKIFMTLYIHDKVDKLFHGTAKIMASARFKDSNKVEFNNHVTTVNVTGNKKDIALDIQEDLGINFPTKDMVLKFDVEVTNSMTQNSIKASRETEMRHKGKHSFEVVRKKYFKPGFKYQVRVRVKHVNGHLDNSFNQLSMTIKYAASKTKINEKTYQINLKNGETVTNLQPESDTKQILIVLEFAGTTHTEKIDRFPTLGANEYMQVTTVGKSQSNGNQVQFQAQTSGEMETLHVLVIGTFGIVYSNEFKDAVQKDIFNFSIPITDEMKPEARGIVFYVRPSDGVIVFDEFSISAGFSIDNSLEITTSSDVVKPGEKVDFNVKTEAGSRLYLTAVENNPYSIVRMNEISKSDIYNELVHYLNLKYPSTSDYHLEKLNAFIYEAMAKGLCNTNNANFQPTDEENSNIDRWPGRYFPKTWTDESHEIKQGVSVIKAQSPINYATWRIYGLSVHPQKGFTVAKVQPKVTAKTEISPYIEAPQSAYESEAFLMKVSAFNFLREALPNAQIKIAIDGAKSVSERVKSSFNLRNSRVDCYELKAGGKVSQNLRKNLPPETMTYLSEYLIQSDNTGDIKITVSVQANNYVTKVEKIIKVLNADRITSNLIESRMITLNGNKRSEKIDAVRNLQNSGYVKVFGNLLGPGLDGLENIFDKPLTTDEEKILKFQLAVINYKFMNLIQRDANPEAIKAFDDIELGYQEAVAILDNIMQNQDTKSIWLAAFAAETLIDASEMINIDHQFLINVLEFIKTQQKSDGSFKYDAHADHRRNIALKYRKEVEAALIIPAFIKSKNLQNMPTYRPEVQKSIDFIKRQGNGGDYIKIVTAYTSALNGDQAHAKSLLQGMSNSFLTSDKSAHYSTYVEIASYSILTKILVGQDPKDQVDWLLGHRNPEGSFYSPYDTVLALKALFEYSKFKNFHAQSPNLRFTLDRQSIDNPITNPTDTRTIRIRNKNQKLEVSGKGAVYISIIEDLIKEPIESGDQFDTTLNVQELADNKVKINLKVKSTENLFVIDVELPRGYKYDGLEGNIEDSEIYQIHNDFDQNRVFIYIKTLEANKELKLSTTTTKIFDFIDHRPSIVNVYDYYRPNLKDRMYYSFDWNKENCELIDKQNTLKLFNEEMKNVRALGTEINGAKSELTSYKTRVDNFDTDIKNALVDIDEIINTKDSVQDTNSNAIAKVDKDLTEADQFKNYLNANLESPTDEATLDDDDALQFDNSQDVQNEIDNLRRNDDKLVKDINDAKDLVMNNEKRVESMNNAIDSYKTISSNFKENANTYNNDLQKFQNLDGLKTKLKKLQDEIRKIDEEMNSIQNLENLSNLSKNLNTNITPQITALNTNGLKLKLSQINKKFAEIKEQIQEVQQQLNTIKATTNSIKDSINKFQPNSQTLDTVKRIKEVFDKLETNVNNLQSKVNKNQLNGITNAIIENGLRNLKNAQNQLKTANQKKTNNDNQIAKLEGMLAELKNNEDDARQTAEEESKRISTTTSTSKITTTPATTTIQSTLATTAAKHQYSSSTLASTQPPRTTLATNRPETSVNSSTKEPSSPSGDDCGKWYRFCKFGL